MTPVRSQELVFTRIRYGLYVRVFFVNLCFSVFICYPKLRTIGVINNSLFFVRFLDHISRQVCRLQLYKFIQTNYYVLVFNLSDQSRRSCLQTAVIQLKASSFILLGPRDL